jgi:hypothetical protein
MRQTAFFSALVLLLVLSGSLLAISSANYRLDWYTPMTTGGGGNAGSTHYAIQFSVGQTATTQSTSTNFKAAMGFWYGIDRGTKLYLPIIAK